MPLRDYDHWNEEAPIVWWQEEGRHPYEPSEPDDYDDIHADRFMDDDEDED
jgi:hypothetical protein